MSLVRLVHGCTLWFDDDRPSSYNGMYASGPVMYGPLHGVQVHLAGGEQFRRFSLVEDSVRKGDVVTVPQVPYTLLARVALAVPKDEFGERYRELFSRYRAT